MYSINCERELSGTISCYNSRPNRPYNDGEITKEATCSEEGEKTYTCSLCGETKAEELDKKEHVYKEDVKEEPTFEEEGEKIFTCENCGYSYTEPIPVRDDEVVVSVTDKSNLPQDADACRRRILKCILLQNMVLQR